MRAIHQTSRPTNIKEALDLAGSLANPAKSTANQAVTPEGVDPTKQRTYVDVKLESVPAEVHLFSDGRFADVADFAAGNLDIRYHRMGTQGQSDNIGIVAFKAERNDQGAGSLRVFLRAANFRDTEVHAQVKLDEMDWKDGELHVVDSHIEPLDLKPLEIERPTIADEAGPKGTPTRVPGEAGVSFDLPDPGDGVNRVLRASLIDNKDVFPTDDAAWLPVGAVRKARVLVVTDGNETLQKFSS